MSKFLIDSQINTLFRELQEHLKLELGPSYAKVEGMKKPGKQRKTAVAKARLSLLSDVTLQHACICGSLNRSVDAADNGRNGTGQIRKFKCHEIAVS